ncbi:MAG: hypothetical protein JNJ82_04860 [Opitutaceae bacterium]|nr:hypothetical protein [Opitutaceae bacterium]
MSLPIPSPHFAPPRPDRLFRRMGRVAGLICALVLTWSTGYSASQPADALPIALHELQPGMKGEVWTVFQGTAPEPFEVEVTGVVRNALGPGKALILCRLTDPRVQAMGAVAGMSGSPLYIGGRIAGALSYQVQRFETVRYAGFTPVADLDEVTGKLSGLPVAPVPLAPEEAAPRPRSTDTGEFQALRPVFALTGLSPAVADLFGPRLREFGLSTTALGGSVGASGAELPSTPSSGPAPTLQPGGAVAVALATGDITIAGTGTVSRVDGRRITAFGHPMLGIGEVALPLCSADIVAILPSNLNSMKVSNTGPVIGTLLQDRLSAVAGELGPGPAMIPVEVTTPRRTLRFSIVKHAQLAPTVTAMGVTQAIQGSNDAGFTEGFRVATRVLFPGVRPYEMEMLYAGPQGFAAGLEEFLQRLNACLQNPFEKIFPTQISVQISPLARRPWAYLDQVQPSTTRARAGDLLTVSLTGRDHQGEALRQVIEIPVPPAWVGRSLELVVMNGRDLDRATGQAATLSSTDIRSFASYLDALRAFRRPDGLYVAVVERASALIDENERMIDAPGSIERIAQASINTRYGRQDIAVPLWETRVFQDRLINVQVKRPLSVIE